MSRFPSTLWSQVVAAGEGAREALEDLARRYEGPIQGFIRSQGYDRDRAEDLAQQFFLFLLQSNLAARADRDRGRFRSFLLTSLRNFLADESDRARAAKRGGGRRHLSIDVEGAEETLGVASATDPETLFAQLCARDVVGRALARLQDELTPRAAEIFDLAHSPERPGYREIGSKVGLSENAVAASVHRTKRRLQRILLEEIGVAVASRGEIAADLAELVQSLGAGGRPT